MKLEKYKTMREKIKVMLNNHRCSDVKFLVRESVDDVSGRKQVLPAHRLYWRLAARCLKQCFTVTS